MRFQREISGEAGRFSEGSTRREAVSIRERRSRTPAPWTRLHDVSLGLVVGILVFLALLLVATASWGQTRALSSEEPNFWGLVQPEAEELASVGFAGSGMGAAAFMKARTLPKLHGPLWHVADVEGGYASIRSTVSPLKCGCFTADGGNGSMVYHLTEYFGLAGDGARVWAPGTGGNQGLNLTTYLGGPQASVLLMGRLLPFGHFLLGKAQVDGLASQTGSSSAAAFADGWGGGVDLVLSHDTSVRLAEIDEDITHFHETLGPRQSNLRLVFGVVFHFKTK
jgi:hypothetical protein